MNGHGWECEFCHKQVILETPYNYYDNSYPPKDWYVLVGPSKGLNNSENLRDVERKDFCSLSCVESHARLESIGPVPVTIPSESNVTVDIINKIIHNYLSDVKNGKYVV